MVHGSRSHLALGLIVILGGSVPAVVQAQDFFSALFGGLGGGRSSPQIRMPFASESSPDDLQPRPGTSRPRIGYGGGQAWCVRTCDGRYFPISGAGDQGRVAACGGLCPAAETKVVYGGNIDNAETEAGKSYSELPNAFRYRTELVEGCTCNGRGQIGLAQVKIEDDPTLRKGDIVAGADGLMVASGSAGRRAALNFSPVSPAIQARYRSAPVEATE
jgi:Protein of unknown function (DUF2865)